MVTTTAAPGIQEAGQGEIEEGVAIVAPVAMVDFTLNPHSSLLLHPPDHRPQSAGAIGQIEIDSNSQRSLPRGHGREMERQIKGIRVQGMIAPARQHVTRRAGVEI
jgi:hypothetical protein